jgi:hypothetical protein
LSLGRPPENIAGGLFLLRLPAPAIRCLKPGPFESGLSILAQSEVMASLMRNSSEGRRCCASTASVKNGSVAAAVVWWIAWSQKTVRIQEPPRDLIVRLSALEAVKEPEK